MTHLKGTTRSVGYVQMRVRGELLYRLQTVALAKGHTGPGAAPNIFGLTEAYLLEGLERDERELRDLAAMKRFGSLGPNVCYWRREITGQKTPCVKLATEHDGWNSVYLPGSPFAGESCATPLEEIVEVIPCS